MVSVRALFASLWSRLEETNTYQTLKAWKIDPPEMPMLHLVGYAAALLAFFFVLTGGSIALIRAHDAKEAAYVLAMRERAFDRERVDKNNDCHAQLQILDGNLQSCLASVPVPDCKPHPPARRKKTGGKASIAPVSPFPW